MSSLAQRKRAHEDVDTRPADTPPFPRIPALCQSLIGGTAAPANEPVGRYDHLPPHDPDRSWHIIETLCDRGSKGYAYPARETAVFLSEMGASRILEIGAGSGLFAAALRRAGFDIRATDGMMPASETGSFAYTFRHGEFLPVDVMDGAAAVEAHPDRDILLVMPAPDDMWYVEALKRLRSGQRIFLNLDASPDADLDDLAAKRHSEGARAALEILRRDYDELGRCPIYTPDSFDRLRLVAYRRR